MRADPREDPGVPLLQAPRLPPASSPDGAWMRALYGWLASFDSAHTREAYLRDVGQWTTWLEQAAVDPWAASRPLAAGWRHHLTATRQLKASTVARKLSATCSLYNFALDEAAVDENPFARLSRPTVATDDAAAAGLGFGLLSTAGGLLAGLAGLRPGRPPPRLAPWPPERPARPSHGPPPPSARSRSPAELLSTLLGLLCGPLRRGCLAVIPGGVVIGGARVRRCSLRTQVAEKVKKGLMQISKAPSVTFRRLLIYEG